MKQIHHIRDRCDYCGACVSVCPPDAIDLTEHTLTILDTCTLCKNCVIICPLQALEVRDEN